MNWRDIDGGTPLRCGLCGEQIGKTLIHEVPVDPEVVIARCFDCAASEAADRITKEAAS